MKHWMLGNTIIAVAALAVAVSAIAGDTEAQVVYNDAWWTCEASLDNGSTRRGDYVGSYPQAAAQARAQLAGDFIIQQVWCEPSGTSRRYAAAGHTHEGLEGPQGERGPRGPQGPEGERGPRGHAGASHSHHDPAVHGTIHHTRDLCYPITSGLMCHGVVH